MNIEILTFCIIADVILTIITETICATIRYNNLYYNQLLFPEFTLEKTDLFLFIFFPFYLAFLVVTFISLVAFSPIFLGCYIMDRLYEKGIAKSLKNSTK